MSRALEIKAELFGEQSWEYFISLSELAEIQWAAVQPEESRVSYLTALSLGILLKDQHACPTSGLCLYGFG
jgi:hypothetical protein